MFFAFWFMDMALVVRYLESRRNTVNMLPSPVLPASSIIRLSASL